jgi:hypothetical protein
VGGVAVTADTVVLAAVDTESVTDDTSDSAGVSENIEVVEVGSPLRSLGSVAEASTR